MRNINKYLFLMMLVLSMFSLVSAVPPVTTVSSFPDGYYIEVHPIMDYFKAGQDVTLNAHVENASNGYVVNSSLTCWMHLYNSTGEHVVIQSTNVTDHFHDYEFKILGGNFTKETKSFHVYCLNGGIGGNYPKAIEVTLSGESVSNLGLYSDIVLLIVVLVIMIMIKNIHNKTDFKKGTKKLIDEDNGKNRGQTMAMGIVYSIFKNSFVWMYFLGWIIVLILKDIVYRFNTSEIYTYFTLIANVYSLGLFLVLVFMIGYTISYMKNMIGVLAENSWGVGDGE